MAGGELAAGFTIRRACIEPFREKNAAALQQLPAVDACGTALAIDCEIPPELLTFIEKYPGARRARAPVARAARGRSCACAGCRSRS